MPTMELSKIIPAVCVLTIRVHSFTCTLDHSPCLCHLQMGKDSVMLFVKEACTEGFALKKLAKKY